MTPEGDGARLRDQSLEWRALDDEIVALDLDRMEYLHVNHTGAALWRMLVGGASAATLAAHLVDRYGATEAEAKADVAAFLDDLAAKRLLQP